MGGKQSSGKDTVQLNIDHPQFNNAKHINVENKEYMQTLMGADQKQYKKWKDHLNEVKVSDEYLLLPKKDSFSTKGLCGSSGTLTLDYENYPHLLSQQIYDRKGKRKGFQECEIWYLAYALACAKKDMKPSFSKIGDVRPRNVFINQKGLVKVSSRYSWPRESTNCNKVLDGEVTYLAPEQVKQLEVGRMQNEKNDKSQIFSIGLTLLSAAVLDDFSHLYNIKKHTFNTQGLQSKLYELNNSRAYSDILKGLVNNLVQLDEHKRLTPEEFWTWISPYQGSILARENFVIKSAPNKLHQQVSEIRQAFRPPEQPPVQSSMHASGYSGQKLNFPPPIIRESVLTNPHISGNYTNHISHENQNNNKVSSFIYNNIPNQSQSRKQVEGESSSKKEESQNQSPEK